MTDWKKKIDDEEESRHRREKEEFEIQIENRHRERVAKIKELGDYFKCHICDTPAKKPGY